MSKTRSRTYLAILYPESQAEAIEFAQRNYSCAWVLHDKDKNGDGTIKKEHYHFILSFKNARYLDGVASELGIEPNYLRRAIDEAAAFRYLIHEGQPDKHQYSPEEVHTANGYQVPSARAAGLDEETQVRALLDMPTFWTTREMAQWALDNGCWASFRRNYSMWKDIQQEQRAKQDWQNHIEDLREGREHPGEMI